MARYEQLIALGPEFARLSVTAYAVRVQRTADAAAYGRKIVAAHAKRPAVLTSLARSIVTAGGPKADLDLAVAALDQAEAVEPVADLDLHAKLARSLGKARRYAPAIRLLERILPRVGKDRGRRDVQDLIDYYKLKSK